MEPNGRTGRTDVYIRSPRPEADALPFGGLPDCAYYSRGGGYSFISHGLRATAIGWAGGASRCVRRLFAPSRYSQLESHTGWHAKARRCPAAGSANAEERWEQRQPACGADPGARLRGRVRTCSQSVFLKCQELVGRANHELAIITVSTFSFEETSKQIDRHYTACHCPTINVHPLSLFCEGESSAKISSANKLYKLRVPS